MTDIRLLDVGNAPHRSMTSLYLWRGDRLLLLHRRGGRVASGKWVGSAGGHMEPRELNAPTACVLRELSEELGLTPDDIEGLTLRYITLRYTKGEVRHNYYFFAALSASVNRPLTSSEGELAWFSPDELPLSDMPLTARRVLEHYLRTGCHDRRLYGGVATGDGVVFTPTDES